MKILIEELDYKEISLRITAVSVFMPFSETVYYWMLSS